MQTLTLLTLMTLAMSMASHAMAADVGVESERGLFKFAYRPKDGFQLDSMGSEGQSQYHQFQQSVASQAIPNELKHIETRASAYINADVGQAMLVNPDNSVTRSAFRLPPSLREGLGVKQRELTGRWSDGQFSTQVSISYRLPSGKTAHAVEAYTVAKTKSGVTVRAQTYGDFSAGRDITFRGTVDSDGTLHFSDKIAGRTDQEQFWTLHPNDFSYPGQTQRDNKILAYQFDPDSHTVTVQFIDQSTGKVFENELQLRRQPLAHLPSDDDPTESLTSKDVRNSRILSIPEQWAVGLRADLVTYPAAGARTAVTEGASDGIQLLQTTRK